MAKNVGDSQAVKWYRLAAEQGYARAQYNLGISYYNGEGVAEDNVQAYKWLHIASKRGIKGAAKDREDTAEVMTSGEIAEAQKLAREWMVKHPRK